MKTLTEYIYERGALNISRKYICSQSNKEMPIKDVIDSISVLNKNADFLFDNLKNNKYNDYKIFFATKKGDHKNLTFTVNTENEYMYDKTGDVIYNKDDEREAYDRKTIKDVDTVVILRN